MCDAEFSGDTTYLAVSALPPCHLVLATNTAGFYSLLIYRTSVYPFYI